MPYWIIQNNIQLLVRFVAFLIREFNELLPVLTAMGHTKQMI